MARVTYTTVNYSFIKPNLISEKEFFIYKDIFKENPNYDISPKSGFWQEFEFLKWLLIIIAIGGLISLIWEDLEFIPALGGIVFVMYLVYGGGQTLINYLEYTGVKNKYYKDLKTTIINSKDYNEFVINASKL
jgi:hypothetical protein